MKALRHIVSTAALLCAFGAHAAGTLMLTPASSTVNPGDSFTLLVRGSAFTDPVVGGGFNLSFDPSLFTLNSVSVDTAVWEFASSNGQIDNAQGRLSDVYFNSFRPTLPTGDFSVATLKFTATSAGTGAIQLGASGSFPFANDLGDVISVAYQGANVTVSAVPEPASLGLMALGLAVFGLRRLRTA